MKVFDDKVSALFLLRRAKFQGMASEALALLVEDNGTEHGSTNWTEIRHRLEELVAPTKFTVRE